MSRKGAMGLGICAWMVLWAAAGAEAGGGEKGSAKQAVKSGPRLNVYFTTGFEDATWQRVAFDKVAKSWNPAALPAPGKKAVMIATIARDGRLIGASLHVSSGSAEWDKAAEDALKKASPFPPLPKSWPQTSLEVHWHFENAK